MPIYSVLDKHAYMYIASWDKHGLRLGQTCLHVYSVLGQTWPASWTNMPIYSVLGQTWPASWTIMPIYSVLGQTWPASWTNMPIYIASWDKHAYI